MKHTKRLASLLLALVMVFAVAITAFAAQEGELTGGSITIKDAVVGQTYQIYQLLYLESYHVDDETTGEGQYSYKANSEWKPFIEGEKIADVYLKTDAQGYVTWIDNADAAAFAKLAQAYAKEHKIPPVAASVVATTTTVEFKNLKLGYYLVDSTLGTLCSLDTTNPNVVMEEKNEAPTNEKTVEENGSYGDTNDAAIGQTVNFQSTITAQAGAENYVFHDKMSTGLTFGSVTDITLNGTAVATDNYQVKTTGLGDDCTFHVEFTQEFCDTLEANDKIVISYTATVNEKAVIGGEGNKNESKVEYGHDDKTTTTPPSETKTYTWDVDVFKYAQNGEEVKPLAGAKFTLSKKADGSDPIALIAEGNNIYRVAKAGETGTVTEIETDGTGKFTIKGLDSGTYYLTETAAPAGYNKLAGPITITINDEGKVNATTEAPQGVDEVKVLNQTGSELPETGGMGTTIFYVVGSILLLGAAVLLITKKRMHVAD